MADVPPSYSASSEVAYPPAHTTGQSQGQQGQLTAYPQSQPVSYPQGQAVAYPQGQAMAYPQGQVMTYPQGQTVAYSPGQAVYVTAPPMGTTQVVYQTSGGQSCCTTQPQEQYKSSAGLGTGVCQLVVGILSVILGAANYAFPTIHIGYGIWSGIVFFIPTGILGILSKRQNFSVITAYLIMCILSTLESFGMIMYEAFAAAIFSFVPDCYFYFNGYTNSYVCNDVRSIGAVALHVVLGVLAIVEFITSIVGSAYCCMGLTCCCARTPSTTATSQTMYQTQGQVMSVVADAPAPVQPNQGGENQFSKI